MKVNVVRKRQTRQEKFLKLFPDAMFDNASGTLVMCPQLLDSSVPCKKLTGEYINCPECRRKYWLSKGE